MRRMATEASASSPARVSSLSCPGWVSRRPMVANSPSKSALARANTAFVYCAHSPLIPAIITPGTSAADAWPCALCMASTLTSSALTSITAAISACAMVSASISGGSARWA
ncbi:hypothetical protein HOS07_gp23 [Cronobacter phage ESSI-2]|uniref:Uncharacterized protein n=1 Tax=Cronobacter phage ESSI-2 TaxID=947842 RepID=F1BUL9_9CAUD|nr:hypothetical protein HOS07_gp23 [Cronobacter phage ESSI-2]ADX32398.1 hypothetical protein [Cronobacter phage ESSI-2]